MCVCVCDVSCIPSILGVKVQKSDLKVSKKSYKNVRFGSYIVLNNNYHL